MSSEPVLISLCPVATRPTDRENRAKTYLRRGLAGGLRCSEVVGQLLVSINSELCDMVTYGGKRVCMCVCASRYRKLLYYSSGHLQILTHY